MFIIFVRSIIIFITLFVVMRMMGKRQIGEMQPFELVITLVIADLACIPMSDVSIPLLYGIVAILALFVLHQIMTLLDQSGIIARRVISGKPTLVINSNGVDFRELKRNNLDISDLIEAMRSNGYFSLDDAAYALFEANGKFSAVPSKEKMLGENKPSLPVLFVSSGKYNKKNIELTHLDKDYINSIAKKSGVKNIKEVEVMTIDSTGKVYFQSKKQKFKTFMIELPKGTKW